MSTMKKPLDVDRFLAMVRKPDRIDPVCYGIVDYYWINKTKDMVLLSVHGLYGNPRFYLRYSTGPKSALTTDRVLEKFQDKNFLQEHGLLKPVEEVVATTPVPLNDLAKATDSFVAKATDSFLDRVYVALGPAAMHELSPGERLQLSQAVSGGLNFVETSLCTTSPGSCAVNLYDGATTPPSTPIPKDPIAIAQIEVEARSAKTTQSSKIPVLLMLLDEARAQRDKLVQEISELNETHKILRDKLADALKELLSARDAAAHWKGMYCDVKGLTQDADGNIVQPKKNDWISAIHGKYVPPV